MTTTARSADGGALDAYTQRLDDLAAEAEGDQQAREDQIAVLAAVGDWRSVAAVAECGDWIPWESDADYDAAEAALRVHGLELDDHRVIRAGRRAADWDEMPTLVDAPAFVNVDEADALSIDDLRRAS